MAKDEDKRGASVGAQRVRDYRARRRAAGLVEVKAWVRSEDVARAWSALRPLTEEASGKLARHARQARSNQVVVEVRFLRTPPRSLRDQLRETWTLRWDREGRCWRGEMEGMSQVERLAGQVAAYGGSVTHEERSGL